MSWILIFAIAVTLVLACAVMAVVAIASGSLRLAKNSRWERVADKTNQRLGAEGPPPAFLQKFDHERH